jgi:hypothetical protein
MMSAARTAMFLPARYLGFRAKIGFQPNADAAVTGSNVFGFRGIPVPIARNHVGRTLLMIRRGLMLAGVLLLFSVTARAQLTPRYQASAGFDFTSFLQTSNGPRLDMLGGQGDFAYNVNRWVGAAGDVAYTYNRQTSMTDAGVNGTTTNILTFMAGPRFYPLGHHKITLFGEAMFGAGYYTSKQPPIPPYGGTTVSSVRWAWLGGVGADYRVKDRWSVRANLDYVSTRFLQSTYGSQGSERLTIGVVYSWGVAGVRRKKIR